MTPESLAQPSGRDRETFFIKALSGTPLKKITRGNQ